MSSSTEVNMPGTPHGGAPPLCSTPSQSNHSQTSTNTAKLVGPGPSQAPAFPSALPQSSKQLIATATAKKMGASVPDMTIADIRKTCIEAQQNVQSLTQAVGRQPGLPGSLQDLLTNDLRGIAQQFITISYLCRALEKSIKEQLEALGSQYSAENSFHEGNLEQYSYQVSGLQAELANCQLRMEEMDCGFSNAYNDVVEGIKEKDALIANLNNQITAQQQELAALKKRPSAGFDRGAFRDLEGFSSATSSIGEYAAKLRKSPLIPPVRAVSSTLDEKDEAFLINNLRSMKVDQDRTTGSRGFSSQIPHRFEKMDATPHHAGRNDFRDNSQPGVGSSAIAPYGGYSAPSGNYGGNNGYGGHNSYGRTPPSQGPYVAPYNRPRNGPSTGPSTRPSTRDSESGSGHSGALVLRREDDGEVDPETRIWKALFDKMTTTIHGWSDSYASTANVQATEHATKSNSKLWAYILKVAACYKDPQAASKHALFLLNSPEWRSYFISRLLMQYIEQEMLNWHFWMGFDTQTDRALETAGHKLDTKGHTAEERKQARTEMRTTVEGIVRDPSYNRFRQYKTTEHAQLFKDIVGPFLDMNCSKPDASLDLHSIANIAMEISMKMLTSRLTFSFIWNECAVKFSHDAHQALNNDNHGLSLQHKHMRVMLVVSPAINYRDDTSIAIVPRVVMKAKVLVMN